MLWIRFVSNTSPQTNVLDTDLCSTPHELCVVDRLGQKVTNHFVSWTINNFDQTFVDSITGVVVLDVNVLG